MTAPLPLEAEFQSLAFKLIPKALTMIDLKPFVFAAGVSWVASNLIHYVPAFESRFVFYILKRTVTYPRTDTSSRTPTKIIELENNANNVCKEKLIFEPIKKDVNLFLAEVSADIIKVLKCLYSAKDEFLLDGIDAIVVVRDFVDHLSIKYPAAGYKRSISVNLVVYRSMYLKYDNMLAGAFFLFTLGVMENDHVRHSMGAMMKVLCSQQC